MCHREPEGVEERQNAEHHLLGLHVHVLFELIDIAQDIAVREDDALGVGGRARR